MGWQPLTPINDCPACGRQPRSRFRLFKGTQMRCICGVTGPYEIGEREARSAWACVAGEWFRPNPPNPRKP
jgi:hypothetical protein